MLHSLLIVGYGYTGQALAQDCSGDYQTVYIFSRRKPQTPLPASCVFIEGDLESPSPVPLPPVSDIVFCAAPGSRTEQAYRSLYTGGLKKITSSISPDHPPRRFLYTSSTSVWGEMNGAWVDESTPSCPDTALGEILLEAENVLLSCPWPALICRLAGIYGPGRNRIEAAAAGDWKPREWNRYMNFIHLHDICGMIRCILQKGVPGEVYLACDDRPLPARDFYSFLCGRLEIKMNHLNERPASEPLRGKRCRNTKIKNLGYSLKFPDAFTGYESLFNASA